MSEQIRQVLRVRFAVAGPRGKWWVEIRRDSQQEPLALVPVRTALPGEPPRTEWHLRSPDGSQLPLMVTLCAPGSEVAGLGIKRYRGQIALRLLELPGGTHAVPTLEAVLLHGELTLPLADLDELMPGEVSLADSANRTEFSGLEWHAVLARLWPPAQVLMDRDPLLRRGTAVDHSALQRAVSSLRIEPDGLYIQGCLPEAFYPKSLRPTPERPRWPELVLRTPRSGEPETAWVLSAFAFAPAAPQPAAAEVLIEEKFGSVAPGAVHLLRAPEMVTAALWTLQDFQLNVPGQVLRTLVETIATAPGDDCTVRIAIHRPAAHAKPDGLTFTAEQLGTRIVLGGGNGPDAQFTPQRLLSRFTAPADPHTLAAPLQRGWQQPFLLAISSAQAAATATTARALAERRAEEVITPEPSAAADPSMPPALVLTLSSQTADPQAAVSLSYAGELTALSLPTLPMQEQTDPSAAEHQAWLCLDRGFLALNRLPSHAEMYLDPTLYQPGAIAGPLDLGVLLRDLGAPGSAPAPDSAPDPDLHLQAEAVASSDVYLAALCAEPWQPTLLRLRIDAPLVIVQTPPVWLRALPAGRRPTAPPSLAAALRTLSSTDSAPGAALLDWQALFGGATLVSSAMLRGRSSQSRATAQAQGLELLTASVQCRPGSTVELTLHTEHHDPILWWLPRGYPLAQSFPVTPAAHQDVLCDDTRGLLPYKLPTGTPPPTLSFVRPFPQLASEPPSLDTLPTAAMSRWQLAGTLGPDHYYLPTLPGVEFGRLTPAATSGFIWRYRHAVPALDEAYSEVREKPAETAAAPEATPAPSPAALTRVAGAVAFTLAAHQKCLASGWLPPTAQNPSGELAIELQEVELTGAQPHFKAVIPTTAGPTEVVFTRPRGAAADGSSAPVDQSSFCDWPLAVTLQEPAAATALPRFQVELAGRLASGPYVLRRHGQPLITGFSSTLNRLVTLDAAGQLQEEAATDLTRYQQMAPGGAVLGERLSGSYPIATGQSFGTALQLELVGVNLDPGTAAPPADLADRYQQQVALHDGAYGWPRLLGFPLYLRRLVRLVRAAADQLIVELLVLWLPSQPDQPTDYANAGGELRLVLQGPVTGPLDLRQITGTIDWRFASAAPTAGDPLPRLLRLHGELDAVRADSAPLGDVPVTLRGLTVDLGVRHGELQLDPLELELGADEKWVQARIHGSATPAAVDALPSTGRLSFDCNASAAHQQAGLRVVLAHISDIAALPSPAHRGLPASTVTGGFEWSLSWSAGLASTGAAAPPAFVAVLAFAPAQTPVWRLGIKRSAPGADAQELLALTLKAQPIADRRLLLIAESTGQPPLLPPGAWFTRSRPDLGIIAVAFAAPDQLGSLAAEVRMTLQGRGEPSPCSAGTRLQAQLRLASPSGLLPDDPPADPESGATAALWLTGELILRNDLRLQPAAAPAETELHQVSLFLDQARLPLAALPALFFGEGPPADLLLGAVVEHRLQLLVRPGQSTDRRLARWQVPQVVRLTTAERYAHRYLSAPAPRDLQLVVDLHSAFILKQGTGTPLASRLAGDVTCPGQVALSLQGRPRVLPQLGASYGVRLPAAAGVAHLKITIQLTPPLTKEHPVAGSLLHYPSLGMQPVPLTLEETDAEERDRMAAFVARSPQARWLSSEALCQALLPSMLDPEPWLQPAFAKGRSAAVTLPAQLSDLEWLRSLTREAADALAAGLLMRQRLNRTSDSGQPEPGVTLLEYPFLVVARDLQPAASSAAGPGPDVDVQVVCICEGQLRRVAHERVPLPAELSPQQAVQSWASQLLQERRRHEPAVLLLDYADQPSGVVMLLRLDQAQQADSARARVPRTAYGPAVPPLDERVREPESSAGPVRSEPSLRSTIFAAWPTATVPGERTIGATVFRLAPTGIAAGSGEGYEGRLRPARARPLLSGDGLRTTQQILTCHKWEQVPFAAQQGTSPFPRVASRMVLQRLPMLAVPQGAETRYSVLPPLIDLVVWASRPGELIQTHLGLAASQRLLTADPTPQDLTVNAIGPSQQITLRRPRALAAPSEHAVLQHVATRPGLGGRLEVIDFQLTQTLGVTAAPDASTKVGAVVTTRDTYTVAATSLEAAKQDTPVLFLVPPLGTDNLTPARQRDLDTMPVLQLVAHPSYRPSSDSPESGVQTLVLVFRGNTAPDWEDVPASLGKPIRVVLENLAGPPAVGWRELTAADGSIAAYACSVALGSDLLTLRLNGTEKDKPTFVGLFTLRTEPTGKKTLHLEQATQIAYLDQAGAIVAPKLALALLADSATAEESSLVGYRRLGQDDFTPLAPEVLSPVAAPKPLAIQWTRRAELRHVQRSSAAPEPPSFDAVLFGPSGEDIPTRVVIR